MGPAVLFSGWEPRGLSPGVKALTSSLLPGAEWPWAPPPFCGPWAGAAPSCGGRITIGIRWQVVALRVERRETLIMCCVLLCCHSFTYGKALFPPNLHRKTFFFLRCKFPSTLYLMKWRVGR